MESVSDRVNERATELLDGRADGGNDCGEGRACFNADYIYIECCALHFASVSTLSVGTICPSETLRR